MVLQCRIAPGSVYSEKEALWPFLISFSVSRDDLAGDNFVFIHYTPRTCFQWLYGKISPLSREKMGITGVS